MNDTQKEQVPIFRFSELLLKIKNEEDLDEIFSGLSPLELQEIRDFLEKEVDYLAGLKGDTSLNLTTVKSHYEPVASYYYSQNCKEQPESCANETCYPTNPDCFSRKISQHIYVLRDLLEPWLKNE